MVFRCFPVLYIVCWALLMLNSLFDPCKLYISDGQFPVDIESVEKDHDFLDKEDIQSLFR